MEPSGRGGLEALNRVPVSMANELDSLSDLAIRIRELSDHRGLRPVLDKLSLNVEHGATLCLLGANGSGKTTLLEILAGMRRPTCGSVNILGYQPYEAKTQLRTRVGYVRDATSPFAWMRLSSLLAFVRAWYPTWSSRLCDELVQRLQLDLSCRVRQLSRGQKAKVSFLLAMAFEPPLLLLDEPTAHLDPVSRETVIEALTEWRQTGKRTLILATHLLEDVVRLGSSLCILNRGRLVFHGDFGSFLSEAKSIDLEVPRADVELWLPARALARQFDQRHWTIVLSGADKADLQHFFDKNNGLVKSQVRPATLLDAIRVTTG